MSLLLPRRGAALPGFATELPYQAPLDQERGILLLQTPNCKQLRLALGCTWRVVPVNIEPLDDEECLALGRHHEQLIRGLPVGCCVQTLMPIFPSTTFPAWEQRRAGLGEAQMLTVQRSAIAQGLPHQAGMQVAHLRELPHLVTLRWPLRNLAPEFSTILKTLVSMPGSHGRACQAQLAAILERETDYFLGLRDSIESTLRGLGHAVTALDAEALGGMIAQMLDPLGLRKPPLILPEYPLGRQVLSLEAERMPGGMRFGTTDPDTEVFREAYRYHVLSMHQVTYRTYPGMLSAPRAPTEAKPMALWDAWDKPMLVAINAPVLDAAAEESRLTQKSLIAAFQAKISSKNVKIKENIEAALEKYMFTGAQTGGARVHVAVCSLPTDDLRGVDKVQTAAGMIRLRLELEPILGSTLFPQCLPLGCDPDFPPEWALQRLRRFETLEHLGQMFTLYGGTQGTPTATIDYVNQRGEAIGFDPFDNPLNPHLNIIGTSGAGKTFEVGRIHNRILPLGALSAILDPLQNYRGLNEYHDGELIILNANNPIHINPFYGPLDPVHIDRIAAGLGEMASGGTDRLTWTQFTVLGRALTFFASWWPQRYGQEEPILEQFAWEILETGLFAPDNEEAQLIGKDLALKLSLFYGDGMYAGFVNGKNSFTLRKNLTVIEFGELNNQHLQGVLFYFLFNHITHRFKDPALRRRWKSIWGDELWKLLKYKATAEVMEDVIRTYRNFRISAIFLSQRAEDWNSPVGQIIKGITESNLFLKQGSGEMPLVKKLFDLTAAEEDLFQYIEKHATFNAGYLRLTDKKGGIVRMIPNSLDVLLMAQTPEMQERRAHLATLGTHPLWERIAEAGYV